MPPDDVIEPTAELVEPAAAVDAGTEVLDAPPVIEPTAEPGHTETPTLLTGERPAVEAEPKAEEAPAEVPAEPAADAKPAEEAVKPAEEAKPAEDAKPAEPPPPTVPEPLEPLVYEPPALPEGLSFEAERIKALDDVISPLRVPAEARQQLVDLHVAEMQRYAEHLAREQHRIFAETRKSWRDEVLADEQIGGAGHHTALASCMRMIDEFVPQSQRKQFDEMLLATGAGDHPAMLRFLHNLGRKFDAPAAPIVPAGPAPDRGGGTGRGRRMRDMYDHPRSQTG